MKNLFLFLVLSVFSLQLSAQNCAVTIDSIDYSIYQAIPTGQAPYQYHWSGGSTADTADISAGLVCVTITDNTGCVASTCFPEADTTCSVSVSIGSDLSAYGSGTLPLTYIWNTGESMSYIHPTTAGAYSVMVTSATGCQATENIDLNCETTTPNVFMNLNESEPLISAYVSNSYGTSSFLWSTGETLDSIVPTSFGTYTVTVTNEIGCSTIKSITYVDDCNVELLISDDIYTYNTGQAPFSYTWSTGATTQDIHPTTAGQYSVTITSATGCQASNTINLNCNNTTSAFGLTDSSSTGVYVNFYQQPYTPITYAWSNGGATDTIYPTAPGAYTVTITNGIGCIQTGSFNIESNCNASISIEEETLTANHNGTAPFTYLWSTNATTQSIPLAAFPNTYSVTITDANNCVASATYNKPVKFINGLIAPNGITKRVYLIKYDQAAGTLVAIDSMTTSSDSSAFSFFDIDEGQYYIKATPLPLFTPSNYFPTYFTNQLFWEDATERDITNATPYEDASLGLIEGNNPGGPGFISGYISEGAGFYGEGDPIQNQIVHLLTSDNDAVAYTFTNAAGYYEFKNIALADYNLFLNIINKESGNKLISLSENTPSGNVDFKVNEAGVVLSTLEYLRQTSFSISPNPVMDKVQVKISSPKILAAVISITDILGNTISSYDKILSENTTLTIPVQDLSKGIYFINISVGDKVLSQKMTKL